MELNFHRFKLNPTYIKIFFLHIKSDVTYASYYTDIVILRIFLPMSICQQPLPKPFPFEKERYMPDRLSRALHFQSGKELVIYLLPISLILFHSIPKL